MRAVIIRGLPVFILALSFISLVFGTIFVVGSGQMKSEVVNGFSRSEGVYTAADIEALKEQYTTQKETLEDTAAEEMGYTAPFNSDNKLPAEVKRELYTTNPGYAALIDAQLSYSLGALLLGTAKMMMYSGIAMLTIGVALILVAVVILKTNGGLSRIGASLYTVKSKLAQPLVSEVPESA